MSTQVNRDDEGYLINPDDWNLQIARDLAAEEGISLDENCLSVLQFMRHYYSENGIAPDVRHVVKHFAAAGKHTRQEAKDRIFKLFPYGYVKQACKIAGMKRPRVWSTG